MSAVPRTVNYAMNVASTDLLNMRSALLALSFAGCIAFHPQVCRCQTPPTTTKVQEPHLDVASGKRQRLSEVANLIWKEFDESERDAIERVLKEGGISNPDEIRCIAAAVARLRPKLDEAASLLQDLDGHWPEGILAQPVRDLHAPPSWSLTEPIAADLVIAARAGDKVRTTDRVNSLAYLFHAVNRAGTDRRVSAIRVLHRSNLALLRAGEWLDADTMRRSRDRLASLEWPSMADGLIHDRAEATVFVAGLGSKGGELASMDAEELQLFEAMMGRPFEDMKTEWEDPVRRARLKQGVSEVFEAALSAVKTPPDERAAALQNYETVLAGAGWLAEVVDPAPATLLKLGDRYKRQRAMVLAAMDVMLDGDVALARHRDPVNGEPFVLTQTDDGFSIGLCDEAERREWYGTVTVRRPRTARP